MNSYLTESDAEFFHRLKWLMFCRILFATLLLGSTILVQLGQTAGSLNSSLIFLYEIITGIFILSIIYSMFLQNLKKPALFAYIQIGIDTFTVTLIIFLTGGYTSLFSFLYLVVIIYTSMLLFRKGSLIMASLSSIQYGVLVDMEYYGLLTPFGVEESIAHFDIAWSHVLYKITIIIVACFAVAFLSGILAEQSKESKKELRAMADHLKRVEKMAAVGEMSARLAHEIKNPIASLSGAVQMIKDEIQHDPGLDRMMQIILRETERLRELVNDFLMFARPPKGKVELIDIEKEVTEIIELFQKDCMCLGRITINQDIMPCVKIEIDPAHFKQILWNLLLNSAEAIDAVKGKGTILIRAYPIKSGHVLIKIIDNGSGIPEETLRYIFDPFYTTKTQGSGLGLSIVHRIVDSYDGRLDVESVENVGTTFTLKMKKPE